MSTTTHYRATPIQEPFRHYAIDWSATTDRTDTPDIVALFREFLEGAAAYAAIDVDMAAIHADLAPASFESVPED